MKHLKRQGCELYDEGAEHSKFRKQDDGKEKHCPQHSEIDNDLARDICKQLGVQRPN